MDDPSKTPEQTPKKTTRKRKSKTISPNYASLTVVLCPACRGYMTYATSTQGPIQYRKCKRVGCIHHHNAFTVRRQKLGEKGAEAK